MNEHLKKIYEIIHELKVSEYMISLGLYEGLYLEAILTDDYFTIMHNLGGFNVPSKSEALKRFKIIDDCFMTLCESSEFAEFLGKRKFISELYVFSGQMDFPVAVKKESLIEWKVQLDSQG